MSLSTALWIAGAVTLLVTVLIGEKIIDLDFSGLQPQNRKKAKRARLLAARATPLEGTRLRREMKTAFEDMLLPFAKTDKTLLPPRMDKAFRHSALRQLELLERRQLCREILLTDVTTEPENDFTRWNDDGREWRRASCMPPPWSVWSRGMTAGRSISATAKMPACGCCNPGISAPPTVTGRKKATMLTG